MPTNKNSSVQSTSMPIELSFDDGVTWKTLVCLVSYQVPFNTPITEEDTFCGTEVGMGNTKFNPSGEAVCAFIPDALEVSVTELQDAQEAKQSILWRIQNPQSGSVGDLFYRSGSAKVTNVTVTAQTNSLYRFTWTLTGEGLLITEKPE